MLKAKTIQASAPIEITEALDTVRSKGLAPRSRSSLIVHYVLLGLKSDAERYPEVKSILNRLWEKRILNILAADTK